MILTIGCNALAIYLPSMAFRSIFGIDLYYSILIFGSMCVLYSVSGLKAVLWTDIFLIGVMFASLIVVTTVGTYQSGGFERVYLFVSDGGRLNFDDFLNFDLTTRHTLIGILLGATLKEVYIMGANPAHVQRACNLPSLKHGQTSFILSSFLTAVLISLATYSGAVIYATFGYCDPSIGNDGPPRRDVILLHYVANHLSFVPGIRGLFVAGIFLVSMTIINTTTNGMAMILLGYLRPIVSWCTSAEGQDNENQSVFLPKILTLMFGYICVLAAYAMDSAQSRLLQASVTMSAAIGAPILGAIVLGMFTSFANTTGIIAGFVVNIPLGLYVTFKHVFVKPPLEPTMFVLYDEECESIFNRTSEPKHEPLVTNRLVNESTLIEDLRVVTKQLYFELADISYVALPVVQFISMILIASLISLLTGGCGQMIPGELTTDLCYRKRRKLMIGPSPIANKLKNQNLVASIDGPSDKFGLRSSLGRSKKTVSNDGDSNK